jgi:cytoskeletal protein CcmA (bactofilin family)
MPLFVTKNGQTYGPHELGDIAVFLGTGDFLPDDFCWQEGWPEWRPISSVLPGQPAPAEPQAVVDAPPVGTPPPPQTTGLIPSDIAIIGTLRLPDERTVTCRVEGEIVSPSTVIIPRENSVKARIKAESVIIFGRVEGDIHVTGRAVLKSSSTLHGDIHAARVLVYGGATLTAKSHDNTKATPPATKAKSTDQASRKKSTSPPPATAGAKSPASPA